MTMQQIDRSARKWSSIDDTLEVENGRQSAQSNIDEGSHGTLNNAVYKGLQPDDGSHGTLNNATYQGMQPDASSHGTINNATYQTSVQQPKEPIYSNPEELNRRHTRTTPTYQGNEVQQMTRRTCLLGTGKTRLRGLGPAA